jgi:hypothetical protein
MMGVETDEACGTCGEKRIRKGVCLTNLKEENNMVDPDVNKSIILKLIFQKLDRRV